MTEEQLQSILTVISVGCPLQTALDMSGVTPAEYEAEYRTNRDFARRIHRVAGIAEFGQLQVVQSAGMEKKDWKASVWWLERCRPERYAARPLKSISLDDFEAFRGDVATLIDTQVHDPADHHRLLEELRKLSSRVLPTVTAPSEEENLATDEHGSTTEEEIAEFSPIVDEAPESMSED